MVIFLPPQTPALTADASRQEIQSHAGSVGPALRALPLRPPPGPFYPCEVRAAPPGAGAEGQLPPGRPQHWRPRGGGSRPATGWRCRECRDCASLRHLPLPPPPTCHCSLCDSCAVNQEETLKEIWAAGEVVVGGWRGQSIPLVMHQWHLSCFGCPGRVSWGGLASWERLVAGKPEELRA